MGAEQLSSRSIIGKFYKALEVARADSWVPRVAFQVDSDQAEETLPFLSAAPAMREWIGGRQPKGFDTRKIRLPNKHFEATIEFLETEMRRDKTQQTMVRIQELAGRAASHPKKLLSELLNAGESSLCYDGQYFFDTDHSEGSSGTQSNIVDVDVSALPIWAHGSPSSPSPWELEEAIAKAILHFSSLRDDAGEPMHQVEKMAFTVMVPNSFLASTNRLGFDQFLVDRSPSVLSLLPHTIQIETNPRLTWTDKFAVLRTDSEVKPFIHQIETEVSMKTKGAGTDFSFDTGLHQYGIDQWSNATFGFWQHAVLCRLV